MIKIKREELRGKDVGQVFDIPTHAGSLLALANQKSKATARKNIGKMQELIQDFSGKSYEEWRDWYERRKPGAIEAATDKIHAMIREMAAAIAEIDREMVNHWVEEYVLKKTYAGSRVQQIILKKLAGLREVDMRLPEPSEEASGIDGYLDGRPVAIRPITHYFKPPPGDEPNFDTIYFEKIKDGIKVYYDL